MIASWSWIACFRHKAVVALFTNSWLLDYCQVFTVGIGLMQYRANWQLRLWLYVAMFSRIFLNASALLVCIDVSWVLVYKNPAWILSYYPGVDALILVAKISTWEKEQYIGTLHVSWTGLCGLSWSIMLSRLANSSYLNVPKFRTFSHGHSLILSEYHYQLIFVIVVLINLLSVMSLNTLIIIGCINY